MIPAAIPLALTGAQLVNQGLLAYRQKKKANELRDRGPIDPTPIAFRQAQAGLENQRNNMQVAGYGQEVDNLNEGISNAIGEAKRAGTTSANLLNVVTNVTGQKNKALRDLSIRGQNENRVRTDRAIDAEMKRGQYQELGRQENNEAIGALEGASIQNTDKVFTGGVGLLSSLGSSIPTKPDYSGVETMDTMQTSVPTTTLQSEVPQRVNVTDTTGVFDTLPMGPRNEENPFVNDKYLEYLRSKGLSKTRY